MSIIFGFNKIFFLDRHFYKLNQHIDLERFLNRCIVDAVCVCLSVCVLVCM